MRSRKIMRCMLLALAMILLSSMILINPVKIYADVGGGISQRFDPILVVGQAYSPDLLNGKPPQTGIGPITEDSSQLGCDVQINQVKLIPSCGKFLNGGCDPAKLEPGVITISNANGSATAATGIAVNSFCTGVGVPFGCCGSTPGSSNCNGCVGTQWKASLTDAAKGEYTFTPKSPPVILLAPDDNTPPPGCVLAFGINVTKLPTNDSIPATPFKDTNRITSWSGVTLNCPVPGGNDFPALGTGTGSSSVVEPCVTIDKACDPLSKEGDDVTYTITVTNCSPAGIPSLNCTITDSLLPNPPFPKQVTLASGAPPDTTNISYPVPDGEYPGPLVNTASVTCTLQGTSVTVGPKTDSCSVDLFKPCVDVTCTPDNLEVEVGDSVNYKVTVENCIECQNCKPETLALLPSLKCDITDTPDPILTTFPKNNVTILPSDLKVYNENRTYQSVDPDPLTNTVTANCTVVGFGNQVSDSDTCSVRKKSEENDRHLQTDCRSCWLSHHLWCYLGCV